MTMVLVLNITARLVGRRQVSARRSS